MSYRRSRVIPALRSKGARLGVLRARAIDRARDLGARAEQRRADASTAASTSRSRDRGRGGRRLQALIQRDATLKSSRMTVEQILSEATQRVIGRSELSPEAVDTLDERLSELQRRDRATLTHPEEDAPRTQPWFDPQPDAQWRIAYNDLDFEAGELTSEE